MSFLTQIKSLSKLTGRAGLIISKHSPEILLGMGIAGTVVSTVLACKATLKVEALLDEHREGIELIKQGKEELPEEKYSEKEYQRDMAVQYTKTAVGFIKLYGPAVTLGLASIACLISGHGIMKRRNLALVAAYKAIEEGFTAYRKRVIEEHGEEADYMYKNGIRKETVIEMEPDAKGKMKPVEKTNYVTDPANPSIYAKFFDETNPNWDKDANYNFMFLMAQQRYFNALLQAKGHVFLNQVYEQLGFDHTKAGAVVGWYLGNKAGDSYIDFGVMDGDTPKKRAFVNGDERSIRLDFNVDGPIHSFLP